MAHNAKLNHQLSRVFRFNSRSTFHATTKQCTSFEFNPANLNNILARSASAFYVAIFYSYLDSISGISLPSRRKYSNSSNEHHVEPLIVGSCVDAFTSCFFPHFFGWKFFHEPRRPSRQRISQRREARLPPPLPRPAEEDEAFFRQSERQLRTCYLRDVDLSLEALIIAALVYRLFKSSQVCAAALTCSTPWRLPSIPMATAINWRGQSRLQKIKELPFLIAKFAKIAPKLPVFFAATSFTSDWLNQEVFQVASWLPCSRQHCEMMPVY